MSEGIPPSFRRLAALLIFAIAAHNLEEWITFPIFGELSGMMSQRLGINDVPKTWPIVQGGLLFVTVVPAFLLLLGMRTRKTWGSWMICWIASIFLANVFIPHIPAMIILGGYAPGGLTAVLVNLPLTLLILAQARKANLATNVQFVFAIFAGVLSLPFAIQLAYAVAGIFV